MKLFLDTFVLKPLVSVRMQQVFRFMAPNTRQSFIQRARALTPMAVGWGMMAGAAALFLVERIPNFRRDFFCKIPVIGEHWAEYRSTEEPTE